MRRVLVPLTLAFAILPAAIFLVQAGFFQSSDGMIHLYRLFELDRSFHAGIFYPRWFPLSGYGYGLPVLNYYPPLTYYLGEAFHLCGAGYIEAIKLVVGAGLLIAACSMFLFARDLLGTRAALVAGIAYAYLPYFLSDAYVRGNWPEMLAMAQMPFVLWTFRRLVSPSPAKNLVLATMLAALSFAAIILTHHLTALSFAALLLAYLIFLFVQSRDRKPMLAVVVALALGLALSAFYFVPSLAELNLVFVGPSSDARFIVSQLVTLTELFTPTLFYFYLPQRQVVMRVAGFPQMLAALSSIFILILAGRKLVRRERWMPTAFFFLLVMVVALSMMLTFAAPVWFSVPMLRFMQFPWRMQLIAGVGIAFLLGVCAKWIGERTHWLAYPLFAATLIALATAHLPVRVFPLTNDQVDLTRATDSDYVIAQMGWGWTREFVPAAVQVSEAIYAPVSKAAITADVAAPAPMVQIVNDELLARTLHVTTQTPYEISLHTFYYPGWQASIDGVAARTYPRGALGLATVTVPPGAHQVTFRFQDTRLRALTTWVSLLALAGVAIGLFIAQRRVMLGALIALAIVSGLVAWHTRDSATQPPRAVAANLDQQVMLIGYATERTDTTLYVTLDWLALREMNTDYVSFVHLVGVDGVMRAQDDGMPDRGLSPTTRWLPGEMIADRRAIPLREIAPGDYTLTAGMYLPRPQGFQGVGEPVDLGRVQISK